ncbi:hypothetical protein PILCRDRAFT_374228 [Piloderma croceum F 1598]|uniref:Uncharacterized protein n=1 Tax=Piloderma croceum (strain F 1598) TaxID=765440 RepID=A0A0C3G2L7_PILCF|nr:hypothetical protein PILCRDRAFT_374228 [Piloderma croceum F 1598]
MALKGSGLQTICPQLGQAVQSLNCDREYSLTWDTSLIWFRHQMEDYVVKDQESKVLWKLEPSRSEHGGACDCMIRRISGGQNLSSLEVWAAGE